MAPINEKLLNIAKKAIELGLLRLPDCIQENKNEHESTNAKNKVQHGIPTTSAAINNSI